VSRSRLAPLLKEGTRRSVRLLVPQQHSDAAHAAHCNANAPARGGSGL